MKGGEMMKYLYFILPMLLIAGLFAIGFVLAEEGAAQEGIASEKSIDSIHHEDRKVFQGRPFLLGVGEEKVMLYPTWPEVHYITIEIVSINKERAKAEILLETYHTNRAAPEKKNLIIGVSDIGNPVEVLKIGEHQALILVADVPGQFVPSEAAPALLEEDSEFSKPIEEPSLFARIFGK